MNLWLFTVMRVEYDMCKLTQVFRGKCAPVLYMIDTTQ